MRYCIILLTVIVIIGCDTQLLNVPDIDTQYVEIESIHDIGVIANKIENYFSVEELNSKSRNNLDVSPRDTEILKQILLPLQKKGLDFKVKMLENSTDSEDDLDFLNNLTDDELILIGFLSVIIEDADALNNNGKLFEDNPLLTQNIDGDRVMSCLGTATGYSSIKAIVDLNGLMSARTLMETVKAVGKRYLGYVGAAVMVYSFARCMDFV